ncbi:ABC transporter ATP-binding protein, partial [Enterococcus faecium]|nr:ABC transporter ATP-binding protein [Enterococcus faecium]
VGKKITVFVTTVDSKKQPVQLQKEVTVSGVIISGTSAIDYNTLKEMFKDKNLDYQPNFFTVNVNNTQNVKSVQNKIKNYKHDVKGKERPQYTITGVGAILDSLNTYIMLAFYVLAGIAGISLLVSAIMIIVVLY